MCVFRCWDLHVDGWPYSPVDGRELGRLYLPLEISCHHFFDRDRRTSSCRPFRLRRICQARISGHPRPVLRQPRLHQSCRMRYSCDRKSGVLFGVQMATNEFQMSYYSAVLLWPQQVMALYTKDVTYGGWISVSASTQEKNRDVVAYKTFSVRLLVPQRSDKPSVVSS